MPNANVDFSRYQSHCPAAAVYQHNLYSVTKQAFAEKKITMILMLLKSYLITTVSLEMNIFHQKIDTEHLNNSQDKQHILCI